ncbi:LacI family DNA-binding transcriptional regulator [Agromyces sp. NBRC 114283]|uniref:LacI family DNA-binding transcriptional regulator n=1 Tax=Agromyces sp. NBRC 114283 TaxID=2994521 RepID=UPI0024A2C7E8|nr:LacI family DNA-binding transcriptional regulator [Agromyces sp. NBRC 114283]GLU91136.1 LacI family transcriptional regulator [Agromyces sp. NBRC 114283]
MTAPERGQATILDVARLAGVSRTTVSRVLNEPERVTPDTLAKVRAAADRLNFVPSAAARSLRNGRTGTIALLVGDVSQPFHGGLAKTISHEADDLGYSVMLYDLAHSETRLRRVLEKLPKQGVDAVVLATADALVEPETLQALDVLHEHGIPVLTTVDRDDARHALSLGFDYREPARAATSAMAGSGHGPVALLVGTGIGPLGRQLVAGYLDALSPGAPELVVETPYDFDGAQAAAAALLDRASVGGILAATVPMAIGAIRAAEARGLRVPDDLVVLSGEEVPLAAQVRPAITTLSAAAERNGHAIMRLLADALAGRDAPRPPLEAELVVRESFVPTR